MLVIEIIHLILKNSIKVYIKRKIKAVIKTLTVIMIIIDLMILT